MPRSMAMTLSNSPQHMPFIFYMRLQYKSIADKKLTKRVKFHPPICDSFRISVWLLILWSQIFYSIHINDVLKVPFLESSFPCGSAGKEPTCNARDLGSIPGFDPWVGKNPSSILAWRTSWTI